MSDSKNLNQKEELLDMLEDMQDQIEKLQEALSAAQQEKSEISLQNSQLMKEIQKKSEKIVALNEQIEKLNESDLILKKNEELKKQNENLMAEMERVKFDAQVLVEGAKQKYEESMSAVHSKEQEQDARECIIAEKEEMLDSYIEFKAIKLFLAREQTLERDYQSKCDDLESMYKSRELKLEDNYKELTLKHEGIFFVTIFYALLVTFLQIVQKPAIRDDFKAMVMTLVQIGRLIYEGTLKAGMFIAKLGDLIPNDIFAVMVHWLLLIAVLVVVLGGLGALIIVVVRKYAIFIYKSQNDKITAIAGMIALAIGLFLGEAIKSILSINIIALMVVLFVGYTVVRAVIETKKVEMRKKVGIYLLGGASGLGIYFVLIHFFGWIPAIAVPIGCTWAVIERH